jgi:hypothetical protein
MKKKISTSTKPQIIEDSVSVFSPIYLESIQNWIDVLSEYKTKYGASARLCKEYDYDDWFIKYDRPETADEIKKRLKRVQAEAKRKATIKNKKDAESTKLTKRIADGEFVF